MCNVSLQDIVYYKVSQAALAIKIIVYNTLHHNQQVDCNTTVSLMFRWTPQVHIQQEHVCSFP